MREKNIVVQQAGSHHRAFFEGDGRLKCFGLTPQDAIRNLHFWKVWYQRREAARREWLSPVNKAA